MKDVFKSLGITVGMPNLVEEVGSDEAVAKSIEQGGLFDERRGLIETPRERLHKSLYGGSELKNTHGEEFHKDNDKEVEAATTEVEELEGLYECEGADLSRKPGRTEKIPQLIVTLKSEAEKEEDLFQAAFGDEKKNPKVKAKTEKADSCQSVIRKSNELDVLVDLIKGGPGNGIRGHLTGSSSTQKSEPLITVKKQSRLEAQKIANVHENSPGVAEPRRSIIKAQGPGGVLFDFGSSSGHHVLDTFQQALNQYSEPQQEAIIKGQREMYNRALTEFVTLGERSFALSKGDADGSGQIHPDVNKALTGSFDKQASELIEKGQLTVKEGFVPQTGSGTLNVDTTGPAVINEFNQFEVRVGNQVVKATSETDKALLEMVEKSGVLSTHDGGDVIDATGGGRQRVIIDATSGTHAVIGN